MRCVATESHRLHDPAVEVWAGIPQRGIEVPARAEEIARCLAEDDAFQAAEPGDQGVAPVHPEETGSGRGAGSTLNIPLPPRCGDADYLAKLDAALDVIGSRGAAVLVVSLGLDTYEYDPICDLAITADGIYQIGKAVSGLGLPSVLVQEGGYHVAQLGYNARRWLRGFLGSPHPFLVHRPFLLPRPARLRGNGGGCEMEAWPWWRR